MLPKAILLIGGITDCIYARKSFFSAFPELSKYYTQDKANLAARANSPAVHYDWIVELNTEAFLQPIFWQSSRLVDQYGDIWRFFNTLRRSRAREELKRVFSEISQTHSVDVLAHSLGTALLAGAPISPERAIFCGSPYGFTNTVCRWLMLAERRDWFGLGGYSANALRAGQLVNAWSRGDFVSSSELDFDFARSISVAEPLQIETWGDHSLVNYLQALRKKDLLKIFLPTLQIK